MIVKPCTQKTILSPRRGLERPTGHQKVAGSIPVWGSESYRSIYSTLLLQIVSRHWFLMVMLVTLTLTDSLVQTTSILNHLNQWGLFLPLLSIAQMRTPQHQHGYCWP